MTAGSASGICDGSGKLIHVHMDILIPPSMRTYDAHIYVCIYVCSYIYAIIHILIHILMHIHKQLQ